MLAELLWAGLGALPELAPWLTSALATHVVPFVPPDFLNSRCGCNGSPDQCLVTAAVRIVRALIFHPC